MDLIFPLDQASNEAGVAQGVLRSGWSFYLGSEFEFSSTMFVPLPPSLRDQLAKLLGADPNSGAFEWGGWTTDIGLIVASGGEDAVEVGAEKAATEAASGEGRALEEELAGACRNSFAGNTPVLMADGASKPIDKIKVGNKIANALPGADPATHDQVHTVTDVHVTYTDHDYTDVTVATPHGPATIEGTSHHLYWDATAQAWTRADHLHAGDHVQTSNGHQATITALHTYNATMVTYNLTIDGLHTYYVEAGIVPVLVHNGGLCPSGRHIDTDPECHCVSPPWDSDRAAEIGEEIKKTSNAVKDMASHSTHPAVNPATPVSAPVAGPLESWPIAIAAGAKGIKLLVRRWLGG